MRLAILLAARIIAGPPQAPDLGTVAAFSMVVVAAVFCDVVDTVAAWKRATRP